MSKETYTHVKRDLQISKDTMIIPDVTPASPADTFAFYVKRDLKICDKRPTHMSKETYTHVKRDLHTCQKRPTHIKHTMIMRDVTHASALDMFTLQSE